MGSGSVSAAASIVEEFSSGLPWAHASTHQAPAPTAAGVAVGVAGAPKASDAVASSVEALSQLPAGSWILALAPVMLATFLPAPWLVWAYIKSKFRARSAARGSRGYEMASFAHGANGGNVSFSSVSSEVSSSGRRESNRDSDEHGYWSLVMALLCVLLLVAEGAVGVYMEVFMLI
jgi:hypothetical protein